MHDRKLTVFVRHGFPHSVQTRFRTWIPKGSRHRNVLYVERDTGVVVGYNDEQRCKSSICSHQPKSLFFAVTISVCLIRHVCDDHQFIVQSRIGSP